MKFIAKANPSVGATPKVQSQILEPQDVTQLLAKGSLVLSREIANLLSESASGKLSKGSATDLVAYLRLLNELKKEEQDKLSNMTDEELANL